MGHLARAPAAQTDPTLLLCGALCSRADLSDPIDVYSQWIDETEEANRQLLEEAAGDAEREDK